MGYELNQLMKQYGVSSPTMTYAGASRPGAEPVKPTDPLAIPVPAGGSGGGLGGAVRQAITELNQEQDTQYQKDLKDYYALQDKYNTQVKNYQADQTTYDKYKTDYQNRMQNTSMYAQPQFQSSAAPANAPKPWTDTLQAPKYSGYVAPSSLKTTATPSWMLGTTYDATKVPENFNWQNYTSKYADLGAAGIDTEEEARRHYGLYGATEGRTFAHGGHVKTHFKVGGSNNLSGVNDLADKYDLQQGDTQFTGEMPEIGSVPMAGDGVMYAAAPTATKTDAGPAVSVKPAVAPAAVPFGDERMGNIQALLAAYGPTDSAYGEDLKAARLSAKAESDAFQKMLTSAMSSPEDQQTSKAEMYFRLASAFGAPTKTGKFTENLSLVGKELGDYAKEKRASGQQKLGLALKGQEMKMGAAKEDLRSLQALAGEEMKDKRAIATELIKDYIKSGEPQSAAGKQAVDEGLKPGTPGYQKRVAEIGNANVEAKMATINSTLANLSIAQANLTLRQQNAAKLSGPELALKRETEDTVATIKQSLGDLKQAYALNPNSLAGGWMDRGQQFLSEAAGSKDPTIINTRILNNLLGAQGLAKLKTTFGGNPTEGERAILLELEGIGSKTKEERGAVIRRTYKVLQDKQAREQKRLDDISSGAYRQTSPIDSGAE